MKPQVAECLHPPVIETLLALKAHFVATDKGILVRGDMDALNRIKGHVYRKHGVKGALTPTGMMKFNL